MREKIWYEMVHAKFGEIFLSHYLAKQKRNIKLFKILTLFFSTGGVFSWTIWKEGILLMIACIVISAIQLINLLENQLIINDRDIDKIGRLREKYISYFIKLEKLWTQYENGMSEEDAHENFYKLKKNYSEIEAQDNDIYFTKKNNSLESITEREVNEYLNQYHFQSK